MINRWLTLFWLTVTVVLILALTPAPQEMPTTGWDKTNHLLAFSVLFILGCKCYTRTHLLFIGLVLYASLIEILQFFTSYRSAEWSDLFADMMGLVLGICLQLMITKLRNPQ